MLYQVTVSTGREDELMAAPTTIRLVAEKALEGTCGENCVDWAIAQLCAGKDGYALAMLAGMTPPFNHFEVAAMRNAAFAELGIQNLPRNEAVAAYAIELLRDNIPDDRRLRAAIKELGELAIADDHRRDLFDFYLLDCAFDDLDAVGYTYHWPNADRSNIMAEARARVQVFVDNPGGDAT